MEQLLDAAAWVGRTLYLLLALLSLRLYRRRRTAPAGWIAATFGALALFSWAGLVLPQDTSHGAGLWLNKLLITVLVLFPYLLFRFRAALDSASPRVERFAAGATALVVLLVLVQPTFPEPGEATPAVFNVFLVVLLAQWTSLAFAVAVPLWRAGEGQGTLARRRMRLIASAALAMSLALVASAASRSEDPTALALVAQLLGWSSAIGFLLGFSPPSVVRTWWRQPEEEALGRAAVELMAARTPEIVGGLLLPHLARLIGASAVMLRDSTGQVIAGEGEPSEVHQPPVMHLPLSNGEVLLRVSPYVPFFGEEERLLLHRLSVLADLALDRTGLLVREQRAREALEAANEELEAFVYSASHDLKNPLIAMLGYLDVLRSDYGDRLDDDARWYLVRMEANGKFMESLIQDLLELSRVGRMETEPSRVELGPIADELAGDLMRRHPGVQVTVGALPTISANPVRARQLLGNLLENAAKYGERNPLTVQVYGEPTDAGVEVVVADDGAGIPEEYRDRVFGVFERLVSNEEVAGTGIGLAICRKIVDAWGGRIWVADSDTGAEFRIALPASVVAQAPAPQLESHR